MKNKDLSKIFYDIAEVLELENIKWKPIAYRKAARTLETLEIPIEEIAQKGQKALERLPNIGEGIAKKIIEYITTGHIKELELIKNKEPKGLIELMNVPGIGPKKVEMFYKQLNIKSISDLKHAIDSGQLTKLPSIKDKTLQNIKQSLSLIKKGTKRHLIGDVLPIAKNIINELKEKNKDINQIEIAGSLRRMSETIGDIDILITTKTKDQNKINKIMDVFTSLNIVQRVISKGATKSSILIKDYNIQVDLRIIDNNSFGAAMQYFIGNKEHNIEVRKIAIKKGYKLSEYGLFKNNKIVASHSEKEIYNKLGMQYPEPEIRNNTGEIELALKNKLPKLINYDDIKGDLHIHTNWSDGINDIQDVIKTAISLNYEYIAITDHSKSLAIVNGLSNERIKEQINIIKKLRREYKQIKILCGSEVDILKNGELDYDNNILKRLDIVVGSIHSSYNMNQTKMTKRIITALDNKFLTILGHPTTRLINKRKELDLNFDEIFDKALENKKILEINSQPSRLDLNDRLIKKAVNLGIMMSIDSDSHSTFDLKNNIKFGIGQARRGWSEKKNIINTKSFNSLNKLLKINY